VKGIDPATIRELARIVIEENVFVYRNKYYQQINWWCNGITIYINYSKYLCGNEKENQFVNNLPSSKISGR